MSHRAAIPVRAFAWATLVMTALLTAACGGRSGARPPLDADGCGRSGVDLPVGQLVLDSAGLSAQLASSLGGAQVPDTVSMYVRQTPEVTNVVVRQSHGLAAEVSAALERALHDQLLPPENPHGNPPYRVLFAAGSGSISLGRVRLCQATLLNARELHTAMGRAAAGMRRSARAIVGIDLDASGVPLNVRLLRPSGDANVDAVALAIGGIARFTPPRWDDQPMPGATALPVEFVVRN